MLRRRRMEEEAGAPDLEGVDEEVVLLERGGLGPLVWRAQLVPAPAAEQQGRGGVLQNRMRWRAAPAQLSASRAGSLPPAKRPAMPVDGELLA